MLLQFLNSALIYRDDTGTLQNMSASGHIAGSQH